MVRSITDKFDKELHRIVAYTLAFYFAFKMVNISILLRF